MLSKIFGADKKWLKLQDETSKMIEKGRDERHAIARPVRKTRDEYEKLMPLEDN